MKHIIYVTMEWALYFKNVENVNVKLWLSKQNGMHVMKAKEEKKKVQPH